MKETTIKTTTYELDDYFYLDKQEEKGRFTFYLWHKKFLTKMFLYGFESGFNLQDLERAKRDYLELYGYDL